MSWFSRFISSEAGGNAIGTVLGLGAGAILSNQQKQDAKGQANNAQALADKQVTSTTIGL
jgi:hypothetical protein